MLLLAGVIVGNGSSGLNQYHSVDLKTIAIVFLVTEKQSSEQLLKCMLWNTECAWSWIHSLCRWVCKTELCGWLLKVCLCWKFYAVRELTCWCGQVCKQCLQCLTISFRTRCLTAPSCAQVILLTATVNWMATSLSTQYVFAVTWPRLSSRGFQSHFVFLFVLFILDSLMIATQKKYANWNHHFDCWYVECIALF